MSDVVKKSTLGKVMREKTKEREGVMQVSKRAIEFLADFLNKVIDEIITEAVNTDYYRVAPIDVQRGIKKFETRIMKERMGKTFEIWERMLAPLNKEQ